MANFDLAGPTLGALAALGCALAWTLLSLVARNLASYFPAFSLNIIRMGIGSVFLVPFALATGDLGTLARVSPGAWAYLMVSVITAVGIGDTAFFESTKTLGLARAMTISTSYPLMASALALWLFDERITPAIAAGSLVTLGGLVLIVSERTPATHEALQGRGRGLALALVAALSWAVSAILMKPPLREVDPVTIQAVRLPLTTLALWATPWARGTARALWAHRRAVRGRVLALGALTAISAVTFLTGLKYAGIALGTVLSSTSPLFALPIGLLAFGERVTWRAAAGAALCIAGIGLLSL
jgi:drug/metabolite transporter (DMT)-like permease